MNMFVKSVALNCTDRFEARKAILPSLEYYSKKFDTSSINILATIAGVILIVTVIFIINGELGD